MTLFDVVTAPWAVAESTLAEIRTVYEAHVRGEGIDLAAVEARIGRPLNNEPQPYQVVNGVAVVPVVGVLAKRANLFLSISGGSSTQMIGDMVDAARADASVKAIALAIDSPGGEVGGVQQLANKVRAVRGEKPIVAVVDGVVASGAYWIASAADEIYIADGTTLVGSIGVLTTHVDTSKAQEARGVKTTDITAGKYKRIASSNAPLSQEGRETLEDQVNRLYSVFVDDVATNRGVSVDVVLSDMADGRVFVGQQAIDVGLVDGISTVDEIVMKLSANVSRSGAARPSSQVQLKESHRMDMQTLQAEHSALYNAVLEQGRSEGHEAGLAAGASAERERILGIEAHCYPGHEKLVAEMKADGKTTPDQAAARILGAERAALAQAGIDRREEAPKPVPHADTPITEGDEDKDVLVAKAQALSKEKGLTFVEALKELGVK